MKRRNHVSMRSFKVKPLETMKQNLGNYIDTPSGSYSGLCIPWNLEVDGSMALPNLAKKLLIVQH